MKKEGILLICLSLRITLFDVEILSTNTYKPTGDGAYYCAVDSAGQLTAGYNLLTVQAYPNWFSIHKSTSSGIELLCNSNCWRSRKSRKENYLLMSINSLVWLWSKLLVQ
jgi:hypothetical protein